MPSRDATVDKADECLSNKGEEREEKVGKGYRSIRNAAT